MVTWTGAPSGPKGLTRVTPSRGSISGQKEACPSCGNVHSLRQSQPLRLQLQKQLQSSRGLCSKRAQLSPLAVETGNRSGPRLTVAIGPTAVRVTAAIWWGAKATLKVKLTSADHDQQWTVTSCHGPNQRCCNSLGLRPTLKAQNTFLWP